MSFTVFKVTAGTLLALLVGSASSAGQQAIAPSGPLVVIRFTNVGGDSADDWIGVGVAESLATILGDGGTAGSVEAAEQRGAARIVEGTYQRVGTRIRITALLTDVATGQVIRSGLVDGELEDLFALQDALAAQLAGPSHADGRSGVASPEVTTASERRSPDGGAPLGGVPTGRTGFALGGQAIIDGPPPPVAPEMIARNSRGQATMRATRLTVPLSLDGRLDEQVYASVPPVTDFIQQEPNEGALASEKTEAWIFFDDDTIFIAARCWDSHPERMVANEMRRDNLGIFQNENFAVVLDTFYDRRNGYMFHTNPLGGMFDGLITAGNMNRDWNGVWSVRTGRFENGWTVEIAIPFKTVRFSPGAAQTWGVNLRRIVRWKNETSYLTAVPAAYGLAGIMRLSVAGALVGVEAPSSAGNIEIKAISEFPN